MGMALKEFGEFSMQRDLAFFGSFRKESKIRFGRHSNHLYRHTFRPLLLSPR